jgi:AraC family transcriptional regulator
VISYLVSYLVSHLDESADLAALAELACLSPFHFQRVFRGMVGETPLELLGRLRLEIYRSDMRTTPPAQWRTDLFVPVE